MDKYTSKKNVNFVLDVGCGEGYYLNQLYSDEKINSRCKLFGIDISREGISLATRYENSILWSVSDLSNLPFKNDKLDIIIDILSPSNYSEFTRVLNKGGVVIKVIPDEHYLKEKKGPLFFTHNIHFALICHVLALCLFAFSSLKRIVFF